MTSPLLMTMFSDVQDIYARLKSVARPNTPEIMEYYVDALLSLSTEVIHPAINDMKPRSPGGEHIDPILLPDITPPTVIVSRSEDSQNGQFTVLEKSEAQEPCEGESSASSVAGNLKPTISLFDHTSKLVNSSFAIENQAEEISDTLLQLNTNSLQKRKFTSTIPSLTEKKNSKQKLTKSPPKLLSCSQDSTSTPQDLIQDDSKSTRASLSPPSKLKLRLCLANQIKYVTSLPDDLDSKENLVHGPSLSVNDKIHSDLVQNKSS